MYASLIASTDLWPQETLTYLEMLAMVVSESSFSAYVYLGRPAGLYCGCGTCCRVQPCAMKLVLWRHWMHEIQVHPATSENQFHCTRLYQDMLQAYTISQTGISKEQPTCAAGHVPYQLGGWSTLLGFPAEAFLLWRFFRLSLVARPITRGRPIRLLTRTSPLSALRSFSWRRSCLLKEIKNGG